MTAITMFHCAWLRLQNVTHRFKPLWNSRAVALYRNAVVTCRSLPRNDAVLWQVNADEHFEIEQSCSRYWHPYVVYQIASTDALFKVSICAIETPFKYRKL